MVELHVSPAELGEVEGVLGAAAPCGTELLPELAIVEETAEGVGERSRVAGRDEHPGLAVDDELGEPADVRRDHRQLGRHRLEHRDRQPSERSRARRRRSGEEVRHVAPLARRAVAVLGPKPLDLGRDRRDRAVPHQQSPERSIGIAASARTSVEEVLGRLQPPDRDPSDRRRSWRDRGAAATSTALWITTLRSGLHVRASSPAASSCSETQIVTVVSGDISRSETR